MNKIKIKKFREVKTPTRSHKGDAGLDLYIPEFNDKERLEIGLNIAEEKRFKVPMGIGIELEEGYMAQIIERSSSNYVISKAPIDYGYNGEIHLMINDTNSAENFLEKHKVDARMLQTEKAVAQLVITKIATPEAEIVDKIKGNERGNKAFGSSDKSINSMEKQMTKFMNALKDNCDDCEKELEESKKKWS